MALVMLPSDLPWWSMLQRHLTTLTIPNCDYLGTLQSIHNLCNVGLDPDETGCPDLSVFCGLETFLKDIDDEERKHILELTIPNMARCALNLKSLRPPSGLHFSLQQQKDEIELDRDFVASLLSHMFFSTFPKRNLKTHPTLQDFNFTNFFKHLDQNFQKAKLRSFFHYFDLFEKKGIPTSKIKYSRQVMTGKEWLTIEDWLECGLPLCPIVIRHEGRLDRVSGEHLVVCFSSARIGGQVLSGGSSWECMELFMCPELLSILLFTEALEDNEVLIIEGIMQVSRVTNPRHKAIFESLEKPVELKICCMDAENYTKLPLSQYEEDNFLRELNKALLGFRQRMVHLVPPTSKRLSPIGESFSSTPPEIEEIKPAQKTKHQEKQDSVLTTAKRKFILLGSSGECLPVSRTLVSQYSSCHSNQSSSSSEFHSARTSIADIEELDEDKEVSDDLKARKYSGQLDTPERRCTFAQRLKEALCRAQSSTSSESSYAVGISVAGSSTGDNDIRMRRGGSRGFMLEDDSLDDGRIAFDNKERGRLKRGNSSKYSFSTEYSSDLDGIYEQLACWLDEAENDGSHSCQQRLRDLEVVQFASSLLKRTLSESFVGVPLTEGDNTIISESAEQSAKKSIKLALAARSLSLELARHKHKLASQLVSVLEQKQTYDHSLFPVATGNWGCGSSYLGEPQLKLLIQWLATSVAGVPHLLYYTCCHYKLLKLDTVCRLLIDRQWNVGELTGAVLHYLQTTLRNPNPSETMSLFEFLIGSREKTILSQNISTESGI